MQDLLGHMQESEERNDREREREETVVFWPVDHQTVVLLLLVGAVILTLIPFTSFRLLFFSSSFALFESKGDVPGHSERAVRVDESQMQREREREK